MVTRSKPATVLSGASSAAMAHETMTLWRSGAAVTAAVPAAPSILRRLILDFVKFSLIRLTSRALTDDTDLHEFYWTQFVARARFQAGPERPCPLVTRPECD